MEQLTSSSVSLRLLSPWSERTSPRSTIIANGRDTGQVVTGEILEAAVQWSNHYVLFVTDNVPFEDFLHFYLFDADWDLLDTATVGAMYSTGIFTNLELVGPDVLHFEFIGGITWTLELLPRPVFSLPMSDPAGVSRPFSLSKRFRIHGRPQPATGS